MSSIGMISEVNMFASINVLSLVKCSVNPVTPYLRCWVTELVRYLFVGWLNSGLNIDLYQKDNIGPSCDYQSYVTPH